MHRREFIGTVAGAVAAGALAGCATGIGRSGEMDAAAFHASRRFVETRFGRIACVERGSGAAALFLHGFPLNGFQWRGAIERLSSERRCVAPDFLAMGYTEVEKGQSVGPDDQVAMLIALLWLISPIDLIPEFLPVIGPLDDVLVIALALRYVARKVPRDVIDEAWPAEPRILERLLPHTRG